MKQPPDKRKRGPGSKRASSFRLSDLALELLQRLADNEQMTQAAYLEHIIRELGRHLPPADQS